MEHQKRANEEVRRAEQELRATIDTIPSLVWQAGRDGNVNFYNRRWTELAGVAPTEDWDWKSIVYSEDLPRLEEAWQHMLRKGQPGEAEIRLRRFDGTLSWFLFRAEPFRDDAKNIVRWYGVFMDIEARKRAEDSLRQAQLELAHVTRVTTLGELTTSIAHEVSQPLSGIVGNATAALRWLAKQPPNLQEARESIEEVTRDSNRASAIVSKLRDLTKRSGSHKTPTDVNDIIRETVTLVQREPHLGLVNADRIQLQQVLINLIINGVEAMANVSDQKREILVKSYLEDGSMAVQVRDHGTGVDPRNLEKIFEAFFTTKTKGLGMGLSISRSIIEAHGGRLSVGVSGHAGTTFQFTLPRHVRRVAREPKLGRDQ